MKKSNSYQDDFELKTTGFYSSYTGSVDGNLAVGNINEAIRGAVARSVKTLARHGKPGGSSFSKVEGFIYYLNSSSLSEAASLSGYSVGQLGMDIGKTLGESVLQGFGNAKVGDAIANAMQSVYKNIAELKIASKTGGTFQNWELTELAHQLDFNSWYTQMEKDGYTMNQLSELYQARIADGKIILHRGPGDGIHITQDVYAGSEEKWGIEKITKGDETWEDPKEFFEWWAQWEPGAGLLRESFTVHYGDETTKDFGTMATLGLESQVGYYDAQAIYNYLRGLNVNDLENAIDYGSRQSAKTIDKLGITSKFQNLGNELAKDRQKIQAGVRSITEPQANQLTLLITRQVNYLENISSVNQTNLPRIAENTEFMVSMMREQSAVSINAPSLVDTIARTV